MREESLDPALVALLEVERARPGLAVAAQAALLDRLEASLVLPGPPGAPPPTGSPGGAPAAPPAAPVSPGAVAKGALAISRGRAIGALLLTFAAGGVAGSVVTRAARPDRAPVTAPSEHGVPVAAPVVTAAPVDGVAAPTASEALRVDDLPDVVPSAPSTARKDAPAGSDEDLAAERSLIDVARAAISRGNAADGLASLDEHARRYPRGRMTEEREALRVVALARAGREAESRERRAAFERRFPKSLVLPPSTSTPPVDPGKDRSGAPP